MIEEGHFLGVLQTAEAMGDARVLKAGLANFRALALSADPAVQSELSRLGFVQDAWMKIETKHGAGALLNLDHPQVTEDVGIGLIGSGELTNARQYQEWSRVKALAREGFALEKSV